ncbi:MAG: GvpL/GvpF family gas vesicle protein [Deltaproteobacteria bacterium]|nr:GvpL/GvpF family gas vesicle protein [Deltaproteobacteria bacterium]MBI2501070.1 GvpL/GvpF family gas vesicle protein [Deltaproteobacteria bacterium]MBI4196621.1 GvpL/GvpF family gas vesicle protein [Deltaproteobacteria bacterium]
MKQEGKYLYGIIATDEAPNFGSIGIGGKDDEVVTVSTNGLAAVVSNSDSDHYVFSRENMASHMRVLEKAMERFTILPMRFGTVAESTDEIISFLEQNKRTLKGRLKDLDGKVEVGIKILWRDMKEIYEEIVKENRAIRAVKEKGAQNREALIRAGEMVEAALEEKKAVEGDEYLGFLKRGPVEFKRAEIKLEDVVVDASFLLDRDWLPEFDGKIEKINQDHNGRIDIHYVGPMPPVSFVDLELHWSGGRG